MRLVKFNLIFESRALKICFKYNRAILTCKRFVQIVLKHISSYDGSSETHGVFERINGIEQLIDDTKNMLELPNYDHTMFVIRKKNSIEANYGRKWLSSKATSKIKSYYEKTPQQEKLLSLRKRAISNDKAIKLMANFKLMLKCRMVVRNSLNKNNELNSSKFLLIKVKLNNKENL